MLTNKNYILTNKSLTIHMPT